MRFPSFSLFLALGLAAQFTEACEDLVEVSQEDLQSLLPRSLDWNDTKSVQEFVVSDGSYVTPAETTDFQETATYQEVTDFFSRLAQESDAVQVQSILTMPNGEELWLVTVSGEQRFSPDDMQNPTILATAGIHAGESSGVNAGMMFVRNLVFNEEYKELLNSVNFLFVPVFNIQGYLRQSPQGRINQHGPNTSGRRANGNWKNLNRDFSKLDTEEVRAVVGIMRDYDLSFYTDLHSTDGMSYQPDVTWCDNGDAGLSNEIHGWLRGEMQPALEAFVESYDHFPAVCYSANDKMDPTKGFYPYFSDGPSYSTNYADHRQIPSYLLEMHSLKPNKQRVLGAHAFLLGLTKIISEKADSLRVAVEADRAARADPVPVAWGYDSPAPQVDWPIFEYEVVKNPVLGIDQIVWSDVPMTITVEQSTRSTPVNSPKRPYAYVVPAVWEDVIEVLDMHGVQMEVFTEETVWEVTNYRTEDASLKRLREGRPEISGVGIPENCTRVYRKNDVLIKTDQPLGTLAVALLEPAGEGSLFVWGFFSSMLTSHEYPENYIMIPLAEKMLEESEELRAEWENYKEENPSYVNETETTLDWFFRRSAYYDAEAYMYPVGVIYEEPAEAFDLEEFDSSNDDADDNDEEEQEGETSVVGRSQWWPLGSDGGLRRRKN
ncbi:Zn_pept [Seminavis robusta]|uniref:Zn_pept n=1 Tax=Seminavis robusta TaxID=568900 RepID=A0A9N8D9K9_9STRA|nr:Zn_pept [Seminavis robusta]|eukprot:Sro42_g025660.1 Zn_pept (661) ;mRNA; r:86530-88620